MDINNILSVLKDNILPAFGCTDPVTPALAASIAYHKAGLGTVQDIALIVSNDIYKGAYSVIVPGSNRKGIAFAAALGIACGNPDNGLMVLEACNEQSIIAADEILKTADIHVTPDSAKGEIYVELSISTSNGNAKVIFNGRHDCYNYLEVNGVVLENKGPIENNYVDENVKAIPKTMEGLCNVVEQLNEEDLSFIDEGIKMNSAASQKGLQYNYGLAVAKRLKEVFSNEEFSAYISTKIAACAASDARMGGCSVPVMSVFGSGNQGALIFCSISQLGQIQNTPKIRVLRAITLASLIAGLFNHVLADGTPFCDCALVASTAASAGMTYLLNGTPQQMENAAQMTISSMAGLLCDGAKANCAQRISSGVGTALENAFLALNTKASITPDGILGETYIDSCKNVCRIGAAIRVTVEENIVDILKNKKLKEGDRDWI